jgi:hypothetical protein
MPGAGPSKYQYLPSGTPFPADHAISVQRVQQEQEGCVAFPNRTRILARAREGASPVTPPLAPRLAPASRTRGASHWALRIFGC